VLLAAEMLQQQTQKIGGITKKRESNIPCLHLLTGVSYMLLMVVAGGAAHLVVVHILGIKAFKFTLCCRQRWSKLVA
jgi:hypothetical protein